MDKTAAALIPTAALAAAQWSGHRFSPVSDPGTAAWYAALRKPSFTPPGVVFGIAWTGLDALLAYAGYRLLRAPPSKRRSLALGAWALSALGVAGHSWVLFGRKRLDGALGVTLGMVASAASGVALSAGVDRRAARATMPLLGWVLFASVLQEEVWRRNR